MEIKKYKSVVLFLSVLLIFCSCNNEKTINEKLNAIYNVYNPEECEFYSSPDKNIGQLKDCELKELYVDFKDSVIFEFHYINEKKEEVSACYDEKKLWWNKFTFNIQNDQYILTRVESSAGVFIDLPNLSQLDEIMNAYNNQLPYDTTLFRNWIALEYGLRKH